MENVTVRFDVDGYELITNALMAMVNTFPLLEDGEQFEFATESEDEGVAIFPTTGSFIYDERESITGHVVQMCQYPFTVVYRASGLSSKRRINAVEWLNTFGRWIERQPVTIDDRTYVLQEWPELTENREIREITRQAPAYLTSVNEDKSENWIMDVVVRYRNEFDR